MLSHQTEKTLKRYHQPSGFRLGSTLGMTLIELIFVMSVLGLLASLGIPKAQQMVEHARVAKAIGDIRALQTDIDSYAGSNDILPADLAVIGRAGFLDPWGTPYQYLNFAQAGNGNGVPQGARRDRFLVPINSTYDLYSMGKDGSSVAPLTAGASKDDIVRGNDGGFIGLGRLY